jgi:folate-dependent phosphoribosylglycinamide formyltransferase PurN
MPSKKALIIGTPGVNTELLYQTVRQLFHVQKVVLEQPEKKNHILRRRLKKLGLFQVIGQVLFLTFAVPFIPARKKRIAAILAAYKLSNEQIPEDEIMSITSVHEESFASWLMNQEYDLVCINGTRILSQQLLDTINSPIINIHVGITPSYRGVHGGYWALREGRPDLFGVTLHYVDKGIDTGEIIAQSVLPTDKDDNFKTYPLLQYCEGLRLLKVHQAELFESNSAEKQLSQKKSSKLHYHPTLLAYLTGRLKGIK